MWVAFASAFSWACTTIMLRGLAARMDSFLANGLRTAVGLLLVVPLALLTEGPKGYAALTPGLVALLGGSVILGGVLGDSLYIGALQRISVGRAFPVANTYPLFTFLFSVLLLGTAPTWEMLAGVILVMAGVYFVARPRKHIAPREEPASDRKLLLQGLAMAGGAAILWGLNTVILSIGLREVHSAVANSVRMPVVAVGSLLAAAIRGKLPTIRQIDRKSLILLIATGLWGAGLGSTLYVAGVEAVGPTRMATIGAASPLFAVPLTALFLKEHPTRYTLLGTILTIAGVVLVI
ncbi:MAG: DMT family transporter [Chloroflexi bacterium]|nr:DMT family transporter [Chloroflexota bacterium]